MDRTVQLALQAAGQAYADAHLDTQPSTGALGIIAGTSRGPLQKWTEMLDLARSRSRSLPPTLAANSTLACLSGALAIAFEASGPSLTRFGDLRFGSPRHRARRRANPAGQR